MTTITSQDKVRGALPMEIFYTALVLLQLALLKPRIIPLIDFHVSNLIGVAAVLLLLSCGLLTTRRRWGLALSTLMNFGVCCVFLQWIQTRGFYERALGFEYCTMYYYLPGDRTHVLGNALLGLYLAGFYPTKIWLLFDTFDPLSNLVLKEGTRRLWYALPAAVLYVVSFPLALSLTRIIWKA